MPANVTVVVPAMNRAHLIGPAIDSAWNQSVVPQRVLVVDDGSTDGTADIARQHGADVIELETNGGSGPARNRGIETATTEWIAFLDSDDSWATDHLESVMRHAVDGNVLVTSPARVSSGGVLGNAAGRDVELSPRKALLFDLICTSGTVVRRSTLLEVGLFRDLRRAQDMDVWIRVLEHGRGLALATPTVGYTSHEQQATHDAALVFECVDRIIDSCEGSRWFRRGDRARALIRRHWDLSRQAQRSGDVRACVRSAAWIATRPHAWPTLVAILRQRRWARRTRR